MMRVCDATSWSEIPKAPAGLGESWSAIGMDVQRDTPRHVHTSINGERQLHARVLDAVDVLELWAVTG
jgi:hypothetical protein